MRVWGILLLLVGCGEGKSTCTPGASVACVCSNGDSGAQVCLPDGTFDVCVCDGMNQQNPVVKDLGGNNQPVQIHDLATGGTSGGAKRVFITSTAYGAAALSNACSNSAQAAGLGGTWTPWLSASGTHAIDRITGNGPWRLLDGTQVFNNHANLGTSPLVAIDMTELGSVADASTRVWTGTATGGQGSLNDCLNWSSSSGSYHGTAGWLAVLGQWTDEESTHYCDEKAHLYCFEN